VKKNGVIAAALSAIIPGLGQGYMGRWRRGALYALPIVAGVIAGMFILDLSAFDLIGYAVRPAVLKSILVVNLVIVIWRVLAVTDAFTLEPGSHPWWKTAVVVVLCAVVVLPHLVVVQYTLDAAHALDEIFVSDEDQAPQSPAFEDDDVFAWDVVDTTEPEAVVEETTTIPGVERYDPSLIGTDDGGEVSEFVPSRDQRSGDSFDHRADGDSRITILLVGGDGGPGRSGSRPDSINVVTLDTTTGKAAIFGIPRNMTHFPVPSRWLSSEARNNRKYANLGEEFDALDQRMTDWSERRRWTDADGDGVPDQWVPCRCYADQINGLFAAIDAPALYPNERDPALAALRDTLEILLGLEIDYYASVNMRGFVNVVNALGGVDVYVTRYVSIEMSPTREGDPWHIVSVSPGWRHLNGLDALGYVRERRNSGGDYARMERQRCLLKAVAAKATPSTILTRFSQLSKAMAESVKTDIPRSYLPILLEHTASLGFEDIATVGFGPPFYSPYVDFRNKPVPDLARIQAQVKVIFNATDATLFASGDDSECRV